MNYYDLIDLVKEEMIKQGVTKTRLCKMTKTYIRTMNSYLHKERCMPLDKLICVLEVLGKQIVLADINQERMNEV